MPISEEHPYLVTFSHRFIHDSSMVHPWFIHDSSTYEERSPPFIRPTFRPAMTSIAGEVASGIPACQVRQNSTGESDNRKVYEQHHIISYSIILYHIISYNIILYHIISYDHHSRSNIRIISYNHFTCA